MKCVSLFLLLAVGVFGQEDFATGMAARAIIGQPYFTRQQPGATEELVGGVSGIAYANDMLIVTDSNRVGADPQNHRVLIFKNLSGTLPRPTDELFYTQRCPVCVGKASVVLGQTDFTKTEYGLSQSKLRLPTAVATDGQRLVVADTDNNRILIWNSIPNENGRNADVVVGQENFTSARTSIPPHSRSLRGPQGVWIQNGRLFVADTQNHRVLIWNSIPTSNNTAADIVLGQPDFTTFVEPDLTQARVNAKPTTLLNPVSVTSDGIRLYVTDLGHNRVLVWNRLPTRNQEPADLAIGQPDLESAVVNNSEKLCSPTGQNNEGKDIFPSRCLATLDFPRFALSDGQRLFIADGGNDRILVFNRIPTRSGEAADTVIGQLGGQINQASDAADALRAPLALAWDGQNLYASDAFNRRVTVYSPAQRSIPYTGVRNAASQDIFAVGSVSFAGEVRENDEITLKVVDKEYKYKIVKDDTFQKVVDALVNLVNAGAGDPNVFALANHDLAAVILSARGGGEAGNQIAFSVTLSDTAVLQAAASDATLSGGGDAAKIAAGSVVIIVGENLAAGTASAPPNADTLPGELAGAQVYFDGILAPLFYASPTQINAQIPFELFDTTSISTYVRVKHPDGRITVTTPVAVSVVPENPGIFAADGPDPRRAIAVHSSSFATGTVSIDGSEKAGDTATVVIEDRAYTYTVKEGDTKVAIRDGLIALINEDPIVEASAAGVFTRIRLRARAPGPEGNGIAFSARASEGAQIILTATNSRLCCANVRGALVTEDNPAVPGETIIVFATGLGLPLDTQLEGVNTGRKYNGPDNEPREFVSSLAGGKTANVLFAGMQRGAVGTWELHLELNSDIPTNPFTQLTIAQFTFVSNIVTIPVVNPNAPAEEPQ